MHSARNVSDFRFIFWSLEYLQIHYEVPWLWDTSLNRKFIFSLSLLTPRPTSFFLDSFTLGKTFSRILWKMVLAMSAFWALSWLNVSLLPSFLVCGWLGIKRCIPQLSFIRLISLYNSEPLRTALISSSSYSVSLLGFVRFTCVYYVDSRFCNSQLIPEAPFTCKFTKTFCSLIVKWTKQQNRNCT